LTFQGEVILGKQMEADCHTDCLTGFTVGCWYVHVLITLYSISWPYNVPTCFIHRCVLVVFVVWYRSGKGTTLILSTCIGNYNILFFSQTI